MGKALIGIDKSKSYRVYLAITTDMVEEARKIHDTTPLATAGLGRVLTGAGLMGLLLKGEREKLTLHFKGDGPAMQILATALGNGRVKGYIANPDVQLPLTEAGKLDVGGSLGIGELTVIKDIGLKEPYVGKIAFVTGEIADDLTAYFYISEQQNSSVALGVKVGRDGKVLAAGGMIIQMLPEFQPEAVDALEKLIYGMKPLSTLIEEVRIKASDRSEEGLLDDLLAHIFEEMPEEYKVVKIGSREIKWECDCSRERLEQVLMTIGRDDLEKIINEDGHAEMVCQFCTKKYHFEKSELEKILEEIR
ncbi:MAG TPA: Hsp33 family molecular chaperone HslO [Anaerovoracaceae bacterium]|nr:Hsp33 family molecular chaperone HslO [Anaerovoracaceae bacterium]